VGNRMTAPGAVVDVGEGDHGDVRGDPIEHLIGGHRHHFGAGLIGDGVEDVEVGGEVAGVGEDVPAVGAQAASCGDRLVDGDGGGVADGHGTGRRPDERGD